jgi:Tfp pilus assembly protein PilN
MRPVNLIPQEQRRRTPSEAGGKRAHAVVGVLAVLLAMVAAYVITSNKVTERQNQTAAAGAEADRLEAEAGKATNYTDFTQIAQTRLQSVAGVAGARFDWERLMRELSRVMPAGSWLQTTQASVLGDPNEAALPAAQAAVAPTGPSATLVGCTPKQSEVAKILVRLRSLHRVTDVELNESLREQGVKDVTVDSCGPLYKFDVTVTFAPAAPAEAPRGSNSVPASLGGGS